MNKQRLKQKLKTNLTPQQIQFLSLLQLPIGILEKRIEEELEENPAIEEVEEEEVALDWSENTSQKRDYNKQSELASIPIKEAEQSLSEHLLSQLFLTDTSDKELEIAQFIIGCLDDSGFLNRSLYAVSDDLLLRLNINVSEYELLPILKLIQSLEPKGVAARDMQECLLLQLKAKTKTKEVDDAIKLLTSNYSAFSNKNFEKLMSQLALSKQELSKAYHEIEKLNPKPGGAFNSNDTPNYLIPDFIIEENGDELVVKLNTETKKKVKTSAYYKNMYDQLQNGDEAKLFLAQQIESAEWFTQALKERENTLLKTMNCILSLQSEYFKTGDEKLLKPMKLFDIAQKVNLDISTISRVSNQKYVETTFGTFLLKELFSEAYHKEDGSTVSNKVVKSYLKDIIEREDNSNPYNDEELAEKLAQNNFHIARRTVAKYREQLGIPIAKLRRSI